VNLKTIESINKLKDIGLEFDRLKNELEMMHIAYNAKKYWVGLTDKEIEDCLEMSIQGTCRAIEAKLKEKNGN
jgi:hypothetical protein